MIVIQLRYAYVIYIIIYIKKGLYVTYLTAARCLTTCSCLFAFKGTLGCPSPLRERQTSRGCVSCLYGCLDTAMYLLVSSVKLLVDLIYLRSIVKQVFTRCIAHNQLLTRDGIHRHGRDKDFIATITGRVLKPPLTSLV